MLWRAELRMCCPSRNLQSDTIMENQTEKSTETAMETRILQCGVLTLSYHNTVGVLLLFSQLQLLQPLNPKPKAPNPKP